MTKDKSSSQPLPSGLDLPIPWHLRLPEALEKDFILYLLQFSQRIIERSVIIVLLVYAAGFYVEHLINNSLIEQIWRLRLISLIPVGLLWWLTHTHWSVRVIQPAVAIIALTLAGTHNYAAINTDHSLAYSYYLVSILAILLMATLFRISLYWALTVSLLILAMLALSLLNDPLIDRGLAIVVFFFVFSVAVLSLFGQYFFERLQRQHFLAERVLAMHRSELHDANQALESQASEDPLTATVNRRGMAIRLGSLIHHARQNQQLDKLYVLLFDIDYFKQYNDTYGHPQGDVCLQQISAVPKAMIHSDEDFVARYGGEEFIVALSGIQLNDAIVFAERLRSRIEKLGIEHGSSNAANVVTISVGIAGLVPGVSRAEELIKRADEALYHAKSLGRNRSVLLDEHSKLQPL